MGEDAREIPGSYVHPIKNCAVFPHLYVDINGQNIGAWQHRLYCVKRTREEMCRILLDQQSLEIAPHLAKLRRSSRRQENTKQHNTQVYQLLENNENIVPDLSREAIVGRLME